MGIRKIFSTLMLLAGFSVLLTCLPLAAQDSSAMTGTATDVTGAALPGTTVILVNLEQGQTFNAVTDAKGTYRFPNVPPHPGYKATFSHAGFADAVISNITLSVGITRTQDAKLQPGANQAIEVSASNAEVTLNTTDASIGNNFDVQLVQDLPVQNRDNPTTLFTLQPGYANGSFTGARTDQNNVTVDGMDVNDIAAGGFSIQGDAPVDSVQEFRGSVAGLTPGLGTGSGGQFQLVTKGGTNKFHGNLNEYHRDTATAANTWFLNNTGIGRTPLIRNQFGGNIGGPILHDKLFFFADFNNSRIIQSGSTSRTVPLDSFRNGNLNYIYAFAGGGTSGTACGATSRLNTTPQCIGTLTSAQVAALDPKGIGFDPNVLSLINARYPHANDLTLGDGVNTGGFRFTQPTPDILYNYVGRIDYKLTSKQSIFAKSTVQHEDAIQSLNDFPTDPVTSPLQIRSYGYVVSHIWNISNNKVNQFYFGDTISKLNFPNLYDPQGAINFGFGGLSAPFTSGSSQKRRVPDPEFRDDFNWTIGSHNLQAGGTFKFIKTNSNLVNDFSGVTVGIGGLTTTLNPTLRPSNIRGGTTAPSLYDSLFSTALGRIAAISANYNYTAAGAALPQGSGETRNYRFYQTELYVGDQWKVTKKLTLDYGLRYQLYTVPYEVHGDESIQNLTFDQLIRARIAGGLAGVSGNTVAPLVTYSLGGKANNAAPLYQPNYKDLAPRFAFSYAPHEHTVVNGSAALVYDRTVINAINFIQDQSSFLFQNSTAVNYGQTNANLALATDPRLGANYGLGTAQIPTAPAIGKPYTPYVDASGNPNGGISGAGYAEIIDPHLKDPYSLQFNMGIQQEFPQHFILKMNWVGRYGKRLLGQADASQVVDFNDTKGNQLFSNAFANVTQALRAGTAAKNVANQPWFQDLSPFCTTQCLIANFSSLFQLGDIADFANALLENGLIPNNTVVGAQFALNPWITNKGFSSYNGLLVTLSKNLSHGIRFDANYTWSHSIDNASAPANYIAANTLVNFICDVTRPRECRGNSDFDVQNVFNSNFVADLPVGRGRTYLSNAPRWLDEAIGGWSLSGIPAWRSGLASGTVSGAFVASFNEDAPAIFNGNRGAVQAKAHKVGNSVFAYRDQNAALAAFTGPVGLQVGSRNNLRGPSGFTMDAGLAKNFPILIDRHVNLKFRADFFNVLNHPVFGNPVTDITSTQFGQITGTAVGARVGQGSLRLEF